jgi:arylsulfatase A-like enzyme/Tfp pilus assembly protein PilF
MKKKNIFKLLVSLSVVIIAVLVLIFILNIKEKPKFNVLLITMDTTRADHIGVYGYKEGSTPNLDSAAQNGVTFDAAYTQIPITLPSHCTIHTGATIPYHKVRNNGSFALPEQMDTLAEILHRENYTTAAFIASFVLDSRFGLNQGFDVYNDEVLRFGDSIKSYNSERRAELVYNDFAGWFDNNWSKQFFSWVHFYDPHIAYIPPEPYLSRFKENPYDGEIAYMDEYIGKITDLLKTKGVLKNTLVVIVGDHGEAFGEHGEYGHQVFCYKENLHVPFIIFGPQLPKKKRISVRVDLMDVMPTIIDYLDLSIKNVRHDVQGISLMPLVHGKNKKMFSERGFYFESKFASDALKCAETKGWVEKGYKFFDLPKPELYDLKKDPFEKNNIFLEKDALSKNMRQKIHAYVEKYRSSNFNADHKLSSIEKKRLESLGYISSSQGAGTQSGSTNSNELPDPKDNIESWSLYIKGSQLNKEKKNDEAMESFHAAIKLNPSFSWPYARLASLYSLRKEFDKAREMFKSGMQKNPDDNRLKLDYINFLISQSEFYDAFVVIRELEKANSLEIKTNINHAKGTIFLMRNDFKEALPYFQEVLRSEPTNLSIKEKIAACFQGTNRLAEALDIYLELEKYSPKNRKLLYTIATLARRTKKLALSKSYYERLLKVDQDPNLYFGYSVLLSELKQYDEAIKNIKIFLEKYPKKDDFSQAAQRMLKLWSQENI